MRRLPADPRRAILFLAAAAAMLALVSGCAGEPPVISRVFARLTCTRDEASGRTGETLSVFLVASDPDGIEDLSAFYVINDEAELFWKVEQGQWAKATADGETWIGTNTLSAPAGLAMPGGDYRVVLQDAAGETVEQGFSLPADRPSAAEIPYPRAEVKDGAIVVTGPYENPEVRVYGSDGRFRMGFAAGKSAGPLEVKRIAAALPDLGEDFTFRVWALDQKSTLGVLAGPYASRGLPRQ